jgi:predicted transcriptional regulator
MKSRTRTEVIADILRTAANGEATTTQVMYSSFLSYAQALDFLNYLVERNLLNFEKDTRNYCLTDKGSELLEKYEGISNLIALAPFDRIGASF